MKPLIERALASLEKPIAMRVFVLVSFLESALLPIPVESLSIPLLTARKNPWPIAFWGTVSSVAGGILGYFIGLALFETIGQWLIDLYGLAEQYADLKTQAAENIPQGAWVIIIGAITPIPFKLVSIAAGAIAFPLGVFVAVATVGRAIRFIAFATAFHFFGDPLRAVIHKRPALMSAIVITAFAAGIAALLL